MLASPTWSRWATLSLLLVVGLSAWAADPIVIRGPYLQRISSSGVVVRWRTDIASDSRLCYGPAAAQLNVCMTSIATGTEHRLELGGLSPETQYFYSVGTTAKVLAGGEESFYFVTAPPIGAKRSARIWVLGDSGTATSAAAAVRDAYKVFAADRRTNVWLMLGDNAYFTGLDSEYQAGLFDMYPLSLRNTSLWPAYGNHDGYSADALTLTGPYFDNFSLPRAGQSGGYPSGTEAYYSFDYGDIHFIVLDSNDSDRSVGGPMHVWLENDLASTQATWIIAYWHHPPYTHGSHNSDLRSDSSGRMADMRENFLPLLEQHGVDLVLAGHSHSYERSYLLDGYYGDSSSFFLSYIRDAGSGGWGGGNPYRKLGGLKRAHSGTVYVVVGSSGQVGGGTLDHPAMYRSLNVLGSMIIDIEGSRLDAMFLDSAGSVRDQFGIVKRSSLAPLILPLLLN